MVSKKKAPRKKTPLVSVIVCTLNEEKRIGNCIKHLQNQDYSGPYEIIVADGCSEDKTVAIAKKMGCRVVLEKKRSIASERNAGGRFAQGKLLLFTDADSSAPKNWISSFVNAFESRSSVAFVYGPVYPTESKGIYKLLPEVFMPVFLTVFHAFSIASPIGSNIGIPKKIFDELDGFNTALITCEDLDLAKRSKSFGKLVLDLNVKMFVSDRRIKAWGLWKYTTFHVLNGINFHLFGVSRRDYEDIR